MKNKNDDWERKIIISSVLLLFLVIAFSDFNLGSLVMGNYEKFLASVGFDPNTGQLGLVTDLATGNVGVNVSSPTSMLDINGQARIQGGIPGIGKILTSDANGLAAWEDAVAPSVYGSGKKFIYSGSTSTSITTDVICHPNGDSCSSGAGNNIGIPIPFDGTIKNLYAAISTAPSPGSCAFTVRKSPDCVSSYSATSLVCIIVNGQKKCSNISSSVGVNAGNCLQLFFDEQDNCSGFINWSFEFIDDFSPISSGNGSAFVSDNSFGTQAWSNLSGAIVSDNVYAYAFGIFGPAAANSRYLKGTNFGLSIPSGATVNGIVVKAEKKRTADPESIFDIRARIVKGGAIGATDKSSGVVWPGTDTITTYGGTSDLWGETWTASDVNAPNFGFAIAVAFPAAGGSVSAANIDNINITVYYTE